MPSKVTLSAPSVQHVAACLTAYAVALAPDHPPFLLSQDKLAAEARLPLRTLARALSLLNAVGIIECKRGRCRILDTSRLFQAAGGDAPRSRKADTPPATLDMPPNLLPATLDMPPATFDSAALALLKGTIEGLRAEVASLRAEVADLKAKAVDNLPPATLDMPPATIDSTALLSAVVAAIDALRAEVSSFHSVFANLPPATRRLPPAPLNMPPSASVTPPATIRTASEQGSSIDDQTVVDATAQLQKLIEREGSKVNAARVLGISESGVRHALSKGVSPRLAQSVAAALNETAR